MELSELKKGDRIKIEYGFNVRTARVLSNSPETERIYLKIRWYGRSVRDYSDYSFRNFKLINQ